MSLGNCWFVYFEGSSEPLKDNTRSDLLGQVQMIMKRALDITGAIEIWYLSFLQRAMHALGWDGG